MSRAAAIGVALLAAGLFGASTPAAKWLLGGLGPWLLAGLLYLGSGAALSAVLVARRLLKTPPVEAPLRLGDAPWLAGAVLSGGLVGPLLLMFGLAVTPASTAALLLNLEGLATMAIAWVVFRENVDRRLLLGAAAILSGALLLARDGRSLPGVSTGALLIAGACVAWGIDNNLTRKISAADPMQIAAVKGLVAGLANVAVGLGQGAMLPPPTTVVIAALTGLFGYGLSLMCFVLALRHLGAARTGAYFSTAPFVGAALGVAFLDEPVTAGFGFAAALMALGVWLHLTERHRHQHAHGELQHEHVHRHDDHHQHAHGPDDPAGEPHTHRHRHRPLVHVHEHHPDLHHRHRHG